MYYFLSGDDLVSLRSFLLKLQSSYENREILTPKRNDLDLSTLKGRRSLFGEETLIIVENFQPTEETRALLPKDVDFVFWKLGHFEKAPGWIDKHLNFKLPNQVNTFRLSDCVAYRQEKAALTTLEKLLLEGVPSEIIIGSLVRQFRLLTLALMGETEKISPNAFVKKKAAEQAQVWKKGQIKRAILKILKADWEIKTGQADPKTGLTFLISSLLV